MTDQIRIIVAYEYTLYREAIRKVLDSEQDIEIVAEASKPMEIRRVIRQTKAELLLLDMDMNDLDTPQVLSLIRRKNPGLGVLLFTMRYDEKRIVEAICAGSLGYILKSASTSELIRSIRALIGGEVWIQRKMMAKVISKFSSYIALNRAVVDEQNYC
jgi:two-component system, NarL family, response regulator DegU